VFKKTDLTQNETGSLGVLQISWFFTRVILPNAQILVELEAVTINPKTIQVK